MRKYIIYSILITELFILNNYTFSQKKLDNFFLLGSYGNKDTIKVPNAGGVSIDFKLGDPIAYRKDRQMSFDRDIAIMCNDTGKLLFYTNGIYINDARDSIMQNGDSINSNNLQMLEYTLKYGNGGWVPFASIIVPVSKDKYYIFHTDAKKDLVNGVDYYPAQIKVSTINMNQNNGLGAVVEKGKLLWDVGQWEVQGRLTATQHANGRDWWIMTNTFPFNKYICFLATPDSVYGPFIQEIGAVYESLSNGKGNGGLVFSPDGSKLAFSNIVDGVVFFDFDRCTGKLSNYQKIPLSPIKVNYGSICFSPNSKLLYLTNNYNIYQYKVDTSDIYASLQKIDTIDGFIDELKFTLNTMIIGPNGKIYINSGNGSTYLSTIHNPNERGKSCNLKQHDFYCAGIYFGFGMPNIPNYRLGPLKGSPCDTITSIKELLQYDYCIKIYPNPASSDLKIDITIPQYDPTIKTEVVVVDISGAVVQKYTMLDFAYLATIDISNLASGVYGVQLKQPKKYGERVLAVEKLVVIR